MKAYETTDPEIRKVLRNVVAVTEASVLAGRGIYAYFLTDERVNGIEGKVTKSMSSYRSILRGANHCKTYWFIFTILLN